jgi:hypothetical protein
MTRAERQLLAELRRALVSLHKTLLDWERAAYDRIHGRSSPAELLATVMRDPQFAWLHPLSALIVRIDESLESDRADAPTDVEAMVKQARILVAPDESGNAYAQRYHSALQNHPDAVFAHREVTNVLKSAPGERTH